ncbi:MAG: winged helix-turn-helix domain-containing protein [Methylococcaceae bacterium]
MKKNEEAQIFNKKTGEVKDGYFVYVAYPKAKIRNTRWMMTFQDSLITIAKDKELTGEMKSVLFFLMGNLEFENYITIKQVEIANQLEMQKTNVSRAMRLLVAKNIILKVKEGTTTGYKLNPTYGWKGKVENMEKAKEQMEKDKIIDFQSARGGLESPDVETYMDEIPY